LNKQKIIRHSLRGGGTVTISVALRFIIALIVQVVLARELAPEIFGKIAFAAAVGTFFASFTNTNGDRFVIQSKDNIKDKLDSVFTLELVLATVFTLIIFLFSPFVMDMLGKSDSTLFVWILALAYFYNPLSRPKCLFEKDLLFFRAHFPLVAAQILTSVITIVMVYSGFGLWSLIFWRLFNLFVEVIILWLIASYRPKFTWNTKVFKEIFGFGWPLMIAGFLGFIAMNIPYFIFENVFPDADIQMGYYWLAFQFAAYFLQIRVVIYGVLFPIFTKIINKKDKSRVFVRITKAVTGAFLIPTLIAIFFGSEIITIVFGQNWMASIFPFQMVFVAILIRAVNANVGYFLHSQGITKVALVGPMIKLLVLFPLGLYLTKNYGINGMAVSVLIADLISAGIIYEIFIKPHTGKGVLFFFLAPMSISSIALMLMLLLEQYEASVFLRISAFLAVLILTYVLCLKCTIQDIRIGWKQQKQKS
jgi:O-antigen/teichoic acid export membrane protein